MASCKECYHYEVCRMHYQQKCELTYETEKEVRHAMLKAEKGSPICDHFKDRSRFVELPCKVGDVIFCTTMGKIYQGIVGRIEIDDEGFAIITTDGYCFDSSICYHTQEEAEKVMNVKERENNAE